MTARLRRLWRAHPDLVTVLIVLVAVALTRLPTMDHPLTDIHAFRQTQTAWASLLFAQSGIDWFHPQVPVFGLPFALPLEFPLFQAIASLLIKAGIGPDLADRWLALVCFMVASVAVYRLGLRLSGRLAAVVALIAFTFSPFAILWSRASLIEFMATGAALWFLETSLAALSAQGQRRWVLVALAMLFGSVAMTVKATTGIFWILPVALVLLISHKPSWLNVRYLASWVGLVVIPVGLGLLWFEVSREVRAQNPFAYALNDEIGMTWYFGTLAERLDPIFWGTIAGRIWLEVGGLLLPVLLVFAFLGGKRLPELWRRLTWLALAIIAVAAPAVLINVYKIHDYYLAAITPIFALLIGLAAAGLAHHWKRPWAKMIAGGVVLSWLGAVAVDLWLPMVLVLGTLGLILFLIGKYVRSVLRHPNEEARLWYILSALLAPLLALSIATAQFLVGGYWGYLNFAYAPHPSLNIAIPAAQIEALVPPDHFVALIVSDVDPNDQWNPAFFYYAHREGLMIGSVVRSMGGLTMACADPRYVLLTMSATGVVSRASCPSGDPIP